MKEVASRRPGPISPAAKQPAVGMGPRRSTIAAASWSGPPNRRVPRPVQVNSRAASALQPASVPAQILVGCRRVAQVELDGHPDRHDVTDGDGSASAVGSEDLADQEVASKRTARDARR